MRLVRRGLGAARVEVTLDAACVDHGVGAPAGTQGLKDSRWLGHRGQGLPVQDVRSWTESRHAEADAADQPGAAVVLPRAARDDAASSSRCRDRHLLPRVQDLRSLLDRTRFFELLGFGVYPVSEGGAVAEWLVPGAWTDHTELLDPHGP